MESPVKHSLYPAVHSTVKIDAPVHSMAEHDVFADSPQPSYNFTAMNNPSVSNATIKAVSSESVHTPVYGNSECSPTVDDASSYKKSPQDLITRLEVIKNWGLNAIKCSKQVLQEKLGTAIATKDPDLDEKIQALKQLQRQFKELLEAVYRMTTSLSSTLDQHRILAGKFAYLGQQQPELTEEYAYNAETQRVVAINGNKLLVALQSFSGSLNTLVNSALEDTVLTIRQLEAARVEFDVYRKEVDYYVLSGAADTERARVTKQRFESSQARYQELKSSLQVKLELLHENRIRVMRNQLVLLHNAMAAFFTGNSEALFETLKQFNLTMKSPTACAPSWFERATAPLRSMSFDASSSYANSTIATSPSASVVTYGANAVILPTTARLSQ